MLTSVEIENFRRFTKYRVSGLSRVNLLVGDNGSGKTSVLEAIHLLASGGDPDAFAAVCWRRGELGLTADPGNAKASRIGPILRHLFCGHDSKPGTYFRLTGDGGSSTLGVRIVLVADLKDRPTVYKDLQETMTRCSVYTSLAAVIEGEGAVSHERAAPVGDDGSIILDTLGLRPGPAVTGKGDSRPVSYLAPDHLGEGVLRSLWDRVMIEAREDDVIAALRILEPRLQSLVFLTGMADVRQAVNAGILASLAGERCRVPLGSIGDGMRRLLAVSVSLVNAAHRVLLIDEIDAGLHYSIMGDVWRMVVETARKLDVQVFAATHSFDCVRGLAWMCSREPKLAGDVSVQKIDTRLPESVAVHADELVLAVKQGIEVR